MKSKSGRGERVSLFKFVHETPRDGFKFWVFDVGSHCVGVHCSQIFLSKALLTETLDILTPVLNPPFQATLSLPQ